MLFRSTYVACAPKSNAAYLAIDEAMNVVKNERTAEIPSHLRDAHYKGAKKLGHGLNYKYAHAYKNHYVKQQYLPDELKDRTFYNPSNQGYEADIKAHLQKINEEAED